MPHAVPPPSADLQHRAPVLAFVRPARLAPGTQLHVLALATHTEAAQALVHVLEAADLARGGQAISLYLAACPAELSALATASARIARHRGALVAVGDDHTFSIVAQAAWEHDVPLGVLACGTHNDFARRHHLPDTPAAAATRLLHALGTQHGKAVTVGRVNERIFLGSACVGPGLPDLGARNASRLRVLVAALTALIRGVVPCRLRVEARQASADGAAESFTAVRVFIRRNALSPSSAGQARLEMRLAPAQDRAALARQLLHAVLGWPGKSTPLRTFTASRLQIAPDTKHCPALQVSCDGETRLMQAPLRVSVACRPLRLLVTESADDTQDCPPTEHAA